MTIPLQVVLTKTDVERETQKCKVLYIHSCSCWTSASYPDTGFCFWRLSPLQISFYILHSVQFFSLSFLLSFDLFSKCVSLFLPFFCSHFVFHLVYFSSSSPFRPISLLLDFFLLQSFLSSLLTKFLGGFGDFQYLCITIHLSYLLLFLLFFFLFIILSLFFFTFCLF